MGMMEICMWKRALVLALVVAAGTAGVWAQEAEPASRPEGARRGGPAGDGRGGDGSPQTKPAEPRTDSSTTTGIWKKSAEAGGDAREIAYTAVAGYMPLKDDHDKLRANIFYTVYTAGTAAPAATEAGVAGAGGGTVVTARPGAAAAVGTDARRPITFLFNGGPGAASAWLHLGAAGPKKIEVPEDGSAPKAPYRVVENEYSWLPATDMVFVDPVNTGYSRAATPEQAKEFFDVRGDVEAMGEFIRLYMTKNGRWGSPVFLAGESYGTTRAAALSNYLQERVGVSVSGVVLISTVLNFSVLMPGQNNDVPFALYLPSYAAVGWYHKKAGVGKPLDAWLADAENYATNDYMAALAKGASLSADDRTKVAGRVAELTGLTKAYVLESDLRIQPARFEKELLRSPTGEGSLIVGRFDGRMTGAPTDGANDSQEYDPSLTGFFTAYTSAFNEYVRKDLKYENDLAYEVLSNKAGPWNYGTGAGAGNGYLYVGDDLRDAMTHNPHLKLLVCAGRFDLATPYYAAEYQIAHMGLSADGQKNVTIAYYPAGHMIYHVKPALEKLYGDVTGFVEGAK